MSKSMHCNYSAHCNKIKQIQHKLHIIFNKSHTQKCIFVGYPPDYKGWLFWNAESRKEIISNTADFDERYPDSSPQPPVSISTPETLTPAPALDTPSAELSYYCPDDLQDSEDQVGVIPSVDAPPGPAPQQIQPQLAPDAPAPHRYPIRQRQPPGEWWRNATDRLRPRQPQVNAYREPTPVVESPPESDAESHSDHHESSSEDDLDVIGDGHSSDSGASSVLFSGLCHFACNAGLGNAYLTLDEALEHVFEAACTATAPHGKEPSTLSEALKRPDGDKWMQAAIEEITSLVANGTWQPVRLPEGRKAIGCRWVFKVKKNADGSVERYKARLVAKGFSQRPGFDFEETFSPTAKWAALRAILAYASLQDMEMESIDISNAFLNGDLDHDVYMQEPEGFAELGPGWALKLIKSIYGLKQAGRQWHKKLDSALQSMGFSKVKCDNAIWVYK